MWIILAIVSSISLGFYDIVKKMALEGNNVFRVLFLNTFFCTLFMSPVLIHTLGDMQGNFVHPLSHLYLFVKALIVTASWLLGYFAIKNLPLTIQASINAVRPILVLMGALVIFGEHPGALQWVGIVLGFVSLVWVGFIGHKEGFSLTHDRWLWAGLASVVLWAASGLYDKFLMLHFKPLNVEAWYSFYQLVIMAAVMLLLHKRKALSGKLRWRWSILLISIFICVADLSYFMCLSEPGSMVSIASMIRRCSALVAFIYAVIVLREGDLKLKIIDQCILIAGVLCMVIGSL